MANSRLDEYDVRRYPTDIEYPNLTDMSRDDLERYKAEVVRQIDADPRAPQADWLRLGFQYARAKVRAMDLRRAGDVEKARRWELACENAYAQVPKRMKW